MEYLYSLIEWLIESHVLKNTISFLLTISILLFSTLMFFHILKMFEQKKYMSNQFDKGSSESETLYDRLVPIPKKYELKIREILEDAKMAVSPRGYLGKYFILAIVVLICFPVIGIYMKQNMFLYITISIGLAAFLILRPIKELITIRDQRKMLLSIEVPDYLDGFALRLKDKSMYQATIESISDAGPTLRPYVEKMIVDAKLHPGDLNLVYRRFADSLNMEDLTLVLTSIIETANVDKERANEILNEELEQIKTMREFAYSKVIEKTSEKLSKFNFSLLFPVVVFLVVFLLYTLNEMFKSVGPYMS